MWKGIRRLKGKFNHSDDSQTSKATPISNSLPGAKKAAGPKVSRSALHGLFVLHPPPELPFEKEALTVDIVAVHGLNGKARDTWKDEASGLLWLEDFLPKVIPHARIMTFGYDSSLLLSHSKSSIEDFARDLLNRLWMMRKTPEIKTRNRPLIFVAHSLGGIVVKKALILAHENNRLYGDILSSTTGIVFMGTPHEGSSIVNWTTFLQNAVQITTGTQLVRTDLIKELNTHSPTLLEISKSFLPRSIDLTIMSFIETQSEPPLTVLVVPKESARLGLPNEMIFPANCHHRNICRYASAEDHTYILVETSIKSIITGDNKASPVATTITTQIEEVTGKSKEAGNPLNIVYADNVIKTQPVSASSSSMSKTTLRPISAKVTSPLQAEISTHTKSDSSNHEETSIALTDAQNQRSLVNLRVSGLKPKISPTERGWTEITRVFRVPSETPIRDLQDILTKEAPDLNIPNAFKFPGRGSPISGNWIDCFTVPVEVTGDRPCYQKALGYKINRHQTIAAFFSKIFPVLVDAKIRRYPEWMQKNVGLSHFVNVSSDQSSNLQISFMRTVRIQSPGNVFNPPPGLGTFPLFNTQAYRNELPVEVASQGGIFLPMYERESMYISFACGENEKFAVRPFFGGVNAISGKSLFSMTHKDDYHSIESTSSLQGQDYVVVPEQKRLDGVAVSPGTVKQFVALKPNSKPKKRDASKPSLESLSEADKETTGSVETEARTIEWHMTGKDEVGGIQLQIVQQHKIKRMFASNLKDAYPRARGGKPESYQPVLDIAVYDVLKTPDELGLQSGDCIHLRNLDSEQKPNREKVVGDLAAEAPSESDLVELRPHNPSGKKILKVVGEGSDRDPILFKVDTDEEFQDAQSSAQTIFKLPDASFHVTGLVTNNSSIHIPVTSFEHIASLTRSVVDSIAAFRRIQKPGHLEADVQDSEDVKEFSLVLAPITSRSLCRVDFLNRAKNYFSKINMPLILEMPESSTIGDLRKLVEETTGLSPSGFEFASPNNPSLDPNYPIFKLDAAERLYSLPAIALYRNGQVFFTTLTGRTICLSVQASDTIDHGKTLYRQMEGIPNDQQRWIAGGKQVDGETFWSSDIEIENTVHVVLRLRGGRPPRVQVKLGSTIVFRGWVKDVAKLKQKIYDVLGITPDRQDYGYPDDMNLADKDLLLELKILPLKPVTLGIGVGGNILQAIEPDVSDPRLWDVANSKILHVHIVNSRDFKTITGVPPPATPVSWKKYSDLGLPYQKQWEHGDPKGKGKGVFDELSSLKEIDESFDEDEGDGGLWPYEENGGNKYDMRKVPGYPLVLLEADQTIPSFGVLMLKSSEE